jgi:hypothetical protein
MLQSIVNMRLLKRSASTAGKSVVLITSEHALMPLAGAAGIHVAKNLQSKPAIPNVPQGDVDSALDSDDASEDLDTEQPEKLDYGSPVGELAAKHDEPEEIPLDSDEDELTDAGSVPVAAVAGKHSKDKTKGLKVPNFDRFRVLLIAGGVALVAFIIFLFLAMNVLPKATVTIKTTSTPVSLDTNLTSSGDAKALDESKKIIPAVFKTSDQSSTQQVPATGQQNNGDKATGTATLKNCSDNPVTISAGTGLSAGGLNFITQKSVTLNSGNFSPPPSSTCKNSGDHVASVSVVAQSAGTKYNVDNSSFTTSGGVTGAVSTSGGTDNNVTILTQQDIDGAKAKISSADSDKFSKDFQKQLSDQGLYVLASTLKVGDPAVTSTPAVNQPASTATVNIKITYSVIAVQKNNLEQIVTDELNKKIDKNKEKLSDKDVLSGLTITVQNQQPNSPNATLNLTKDTTAVPIIDEDNVKAAIKGKKENQIKEFLTAYPGVKDVNVKFSPFWVSSAPGKTSKIKIIEQQVSSDSASGQQ